MAVLLVLVASLLGLAACSEETPSQESQSPSAPVATPRPGGSLKLASTAEPSSLDPVFASTSIERNVVNAVYQGLLCYEPSAGSDGTVLRGCLATRVPSPANGGVSADGLTYTFVLRANCRFQPPVHRNVEAADVKYSLERMLRLASTEKRSLYAGIEGSAAFFAGRVSHVSGVQIVDARTLRIGISQRDPTFLHALAQMRASVVAREWVEKWKQEFGRHPLGTGPYVFLDWSADDEIKLARNPGYWEPGRPYLDAVNYVRSSTSAAAVELLRRGEVDALAFGLNSADLAASLDDPATDETLASRSLLAGTYLFLNTKAKPFDDVLVRRAIALAIDQERLAELQPGRALALQQYYPLDVPGHVPSADLFEYAPAEATALLRRAGYPDGLHVTLTVEAGRHDPLVLRSIRHDLSAVGVETRLQVLGSRDYRRLQATADAPVMGIVDWRAALPDPGDWVETLCGRSTQGQAGNPSAWWSAALAARRVAADAMLDPEARLREYSDMQTTIALAVPYVPLYSSTQSTSGSGEVGGFYLHPVYQMDVASYWKM